MCQKTTRGENTPRTYFPAKQQSHVSLWMPPSPKVKCCLLREAPEGALEAQKQRCTVPAGPCSPGWDRTAEPRHMPQYTALGGHFLEGGRNKLESTSLTLSLTTATEFLCNCHGDLITRWNCSSYLLRQIACSDWLFFMSLTQGARYLFKLGWPDGSDLPLFTPLLETRHFLILLWQRVGSWRGLPVVWQLCMELREASVIWWIPRPFYLSFCWQNRKTWNLHYKVGNTHDNKYKWWLNVCTACNFTNLKCKLK